MAGRILQCHAGGLRRPRRTGRAPEGLRREEAVAMTEALRMPQVAEQRPSSLLERLGIPRPLAWGFLGTLIFMIGDGVEAGYLSPYLRDQSFSIQQVALLFTVYGLVVAVASWLSGALSDLWGPRQVMIIGLVAWAFFEVLFLTFGIKGFNYPVMLVSYGLRGLGYPPFASGLLGRRAAAT